MKQLEHERWNEWVETIRNDGSEVVNSLFQTSVSWPVMKSEKVLYESAWQGAIMSVIMMFLVLLILSQDPIMTMITMACVVMVITFEVCIIVWMHWQLGAAEIVAM